MSLLEKLEKVHALLINEEHDKADVLFHEAFVEAAKEVHQSIMEEEDWMEEETDINALDDAISNEEEIFDDEDFSDEEALDAEGAEGELEDELISDEEGDFDAEGEEEAEEEGEVKERLADVEADIERLRAEFEDMNDVESEEHGEDFGGEEEGELGDEAEEAEEEGEVAEESFDLDLDEAAESDDDEVNEAADEELEEAFDELDESFELENVTADNKHAQVGTGGESFTSNDKSVGLQKKPGQREGGEAVNPRAKGSDHKGYGMETAPSKTDMKKRKNVVNRSTDDQEKVSKEGDSKALINKGSSDGFGAENTKSPIGSKGSTSTKGLTEGKKRKPRARKSSK